MKNWAKSLGGISFNINTDARFSMSTGEIRGKGATSGMSDSRIEAGK